ncbi:MAG: sulfotransferase domain-containing protein [Myxococcota bacterium]
MADPLRLPQRTHVYQNHHMDSTRWDYVVLRDDDIVIATSYKAGTTWTQSIVANLLFHGREFPAPLSQMSPWVDSRFAPLEVILNELKGQKHRRFLRTHLPLDGLEYREDLKYLYVARDARDVFMSLWNHYTELTDEAFLRINLTLGRVGDEFPPAPTDIRALWRSWMTRGWFEWETDGWPYWSHLYSVQSWWDYRHLPNVQLIHFADMIGDTEREVRRIAAFLGIDDVSDDAWATIVKNVSFAEMKKHGEKYAPGGGSFWKGGAATFIHKGTNGRWREVLTDEDLELYDAACERSLTPECRKWLENGGPIA